jgi:quaternary ammonium compound-resistance protein SugE
MAWICILLADIGEICWPFLMKWSLGYSRAGPAIVTMLIGLPVGWFLGHAVKQLPSGTVYGMFVGIGGIGITLFGMLFMNESTNWMRVCSLLLVVLGVVGLKLFSPA